MVVESPQQVKKCSCVEILGKFGKVRNDFFMPESQFGILYIMMEGLVRQYVQLKGVENLHQNIFVLNNRLSAGHKCTMME